MPFTDDLVLTHLIELRPFQSIHFPAIVLITDTDTGKQTLVVVVAISAVSLINCPDLLFRISVSYRPIN